MRIAVGFMNAIGMMKPSLASHWRDAGLDGLHPRPGATRVEAGPGEGSGEFQVRVSQQLQGKSGRGAAIPAEIQYVISDAEIVITHKACLR